MTNDGLLFKITANDGTTVLLIYYADLKGPQGEDGAAVNIDDTGTSATKVWSSQKTHNMLDKGIYFALDEPTENDGVYTYTRLTLGNINTNVPIQQDDLIISFDATDISNIKSANMWQITDASDPDTLTVALVGSVGGGKQLYQHCITLIISGTKRYISLNIISDSATPFTYDTLNTYLADKGFNSNNVVYSASGTYYESGYGIRIVYGVYGSTEIGVVGTTVSDGLKDSITISGASITDTVITI